MFPSILRMAPLLRTNMVCPSLCSPDTQFCPTKRSRPMQVSLFLIIPYDLFTHLYPARPGRSLQPVHPRVPASQDLNIPGYFSIRCSHIHRYGLPLCHVVGDRPTGSSHQPLTLSFLQTLSHSSITPRNAPQPSLQI
jgi:hypothetical protein